MENARNDWQNHREEMWDYRADRADQIWDNAGDFYNDVFDDHWWGAWGWGHGWHGYYHTNPWWWWVPTTIGAAATFVDALVPDPVYIDYGPGYTYPAEGSPPPEQQTIIINNQPVPAAESTQKILDLAVNVEQSPPPLPPEEGKKAEWLPLGVFALAQQEKGDPIMFLQLSVNREGVISGAFTNVLTDDNKSVAGQVDKASQRVAWRLGDNTDTLFETSLGNLTSDVSPVAIHFGRAQSQTWLLVRMPEPAPEGKPAAIPEIKRGVPAAKPASK